MLFNTKLFNTAMFSGGSTLTSALSTDTLAFEGFSLSDGSIMVMTSLKFLGPTRELVGAQVPRGDGGFITADYYRETVIEVEGILRRSTAAALDAYMDTVRKSLRRREGNLDYTDQNGTVKRFVVTMDDYEDLFAGREAYHITFCPWKVRFKCKTPFGRSRLYTYSSFSTSVSPSYRSVLHSGTTFAQPVFTLYFSAASSVTGINLSNNTTGEQIDLAGLSVSAGNLFIIDSENKTVTKNGTANDFTGAFPGLEVGSNVFVLTVTGTSFTASATIKHRTTYLC
jgi:phage-related protein